MFYKWFEENKEEIQKHYFQFLRFSSISADPKYAKDVRACAEWVRNYFAEYTDCKAELVETEGYPLVIAERKESDAKSTLLIYGHYDVQPVDPLELWKSPPFEPTERDGFVYARGAVDDKGQIFYAMVALRAVKELGIKLHVNVKFCIEGEEESASLGLSKALPKLKERLKADHLLVVDFSDVSLGARGILSMEVKLIGSNSDLHSGEHGGLAYNPNKAMCQLLSKLWDEDGVVTVPEFYRDVKEEDASQYEFHYDPKEHGIRALGGEKGRSMAENNWFRPVLEINGISGGYTGVGFKTVIPKEAIAKLSVRLVPDQNPEHVARKMEEFLKQHVVSGMEIEVKYLGGEPAFRGRRDSALLKAVGGKPVLSGASIPICSALVKYLGCDIVGIGYCEASDSIHAPNERFDMKRFEKGFNLVARIIEQL